jgi:hypothetical protein
MPISQIREKTQRHRAVMLHIKPVIDDFFCASRAQRREHASLSQTFC